MHRVLVLVALVLLARGAGAIDHKKDAFGIGFTSWHALQPTPSPMMELPGFFSARIALKPKLELGGLLAVTRNDNALAFVPGARVNYVVQAEENLNFYLAAQASVAFVSGGPQSLFAFFFVGPGVEFRFPDFKQLGFYLDVGLSGFVAESFHFASSGSLFGNAGFHYYFEEAQPARDQK